MLKIKMRRYQEYYLIDTQILLRVRSLVSHMN